jgi:hypothetical protein
MIGQRFFAAIETSGLSTWVRESESLLAFPGILVAHTLGMAMVVGVSVALSLRLLGIAREIQLSAMRAFMPIAWAGLALVAVSGLLLLAGYPAKALTNPVFYVKLGLLCVSAIVLIRMSQPDRGTRALAILSLALWMLTITAGRLLPYTYTYLLSDEARF